jgi:dnd system-associated protein 4
MKNIYRDDKHDKIVKLLAEEPHPQLKRSIFKTIRELLCFAAVVGYHDGSKKKLGKKTTEIPGRVFENSDEALDIIYLLALADKKNADILRDENENESVSIFEQYANGGLDVIDRWLKENPTDPYGDQALIAAMQKYGFLKIAQEQTDEPIEIEI